MSKNPLTRTLWSAVLLSVLAVAGGQAGHGDGRKEEFLKQIKEAKPFTRSESEFLQASLKSKDVTRLFQASIWIKGGSAAGCCTAKPYLLTLETSTKTAEPTWAYIYAGRIAHILGLHGSSKLTNHQVEALRNEAKPASKFDDQEIRVIRQALQDRPDTAQAGLVLVQKTHLNRADTAKCLHFIDQGLASAASTNAKEYWTIIGRVVRYRNASRLPGHQRYAIRLV